MALPISLAIPTYSSRCLSTTTMYVPYGIQQLSTYVLYSTRRM